VGLYKRLYKGWVKLHNQEGVKRECGLAVIQ
jgi:hypothetical protein